ncbi:MAG: class I SAM-dependent methyltransferase [Wenzhouxiangellaceae bacterium]
MEKADRRRNERDSKSLDFFRGFLKDPKQVGSVIPSSRFMERKIVEYALPERTSVVVELGPGTGGTTRALLKEMPAEARLLAIDLDSRFTDILGAIDDPRLIPHTGSAADLCEILDQHGLDRADVVVSGIPFSTMPRALGESIIQAVQKSLSDTGFFVAYQFRTEVARLAWPVFGDPLRSELVALNVPPMRIWRWGRGKA